MDYTNYDWRWLYTGHDSEFEVVHLAAFSHGDYYASCLVNLENEE
jgi:hypothetical protein